MIKKCLRKRFNIDTIQPLSNQSRKAESMQFLGKFMKKAVVTVIAFAALFVVMYFALYQSDKEDAIKTEWIKKEYVK